MSNPVHPWQKEWHHPQDNKPIKTFPTHNYKQAPAPLTTQNRFWSSPALLTAILIVMTIFFIIGILVNGRQITPSYKPDRQSPGQMTDYDRSSWGK